MTPEEEAKIDAFIAKAKADGLVPEPSDVDPTCLYEELAGRAGSGTTKQKPPKKEKIEDFTLLYTSSDFSIRQLVTFDDEDWRDQFKRGLLKDGGREQGGWVILDSRQAAESANRRAKSANLRLYNLPQA